MYQVEGRYLQYTSLIHQDEESMCNWQWHRLLAIEMDLLSTQIIIIIVTKYIQTVMFEAGYVKQYTK